MYESDTKNVSAPVKLIYFDWYFTYNHKIMYILDNPFYLVLSKLWYSLDTS